MKIIKEKSALFLTLFCNSKIISIKKIKNKKAIYYYKTQVIRPKNTTVDNYLISYL